MTVSFGSNYRFSIGKDYPDDVMNELYEYELQDGVVISSKFPSAEESSAKGIYEYVLFSSPDEFDSEIEALLLSNGIDFHKQTKQEALDLENIKNRIELSRYDKDKKLVNINVEKFNEMFKKDGTSYIEPNGRNGLSTRYKGVGEYLKTGNEIDAIRVALYELNGSVNACIEDGRHRFAYLRDMGMKTMPVCMSNESYNFAKKYNLIQPQIICT